MDLNHRAVPPRSLQGAQWRARYPSVDRIIHTHDEAVEALCSARSLDLQQMRRPPSWADLLDPYTILGMDRAIARLHQAAAARQRVRVVTDYDVDGTMSSLILQATLSLVAPTVVLDYHIPDRFTEGYGLSMRAVDMAARDGVQLLITADIGVRDHASVAHARAKGIDVLIADHHLPDGATVPQDAIVLCPPQQGCHYANPHLAACGVSLKLASAILQDHPRSQIYLQSMLKLAAIGTVCDLVSVRSPENRAIVSLGLQALNHTKHGVGLAALLRVAGAKTSEIDEDTLGWRLGPRINAAGRMSHATHIIELLTTRDRTQADLLASSLDDLNQTRREVQDGLVERVLSQIPTPLPAYVVVAGPEADGWHRGVLGIVAARIRDELHRPTAVIAISGDQATGSVRSVPGLHAVEALDHARHVLHRYGGHPVAAGFSLHSRDIEAFSQALDTWASGQANQGLDEPSKPYDLIVDPEIVGDDLMASLQRLGPFGAQHPRPILRLDGVRLHRVGVMGKTRQHLRGTLATRKHLSLVWWGAAPFQNDVTDTTLDLLVQIEPDTYRGGTARLQVLDARKRA